VCGNIIYGESPWVSVKENHKYWDTAKTFSITNDFKIAFHDKCNLLDKNFPLPAIQLEIEAKIPWVLQG
jgi:hypothetical protein